MPVTATATSRTSRTRTVVAIVLALVIIVPIAVAAWLLHHVDRYLPQVVGYVQKRTGKQIEVRHATVGIFPLSVRLYDVGVRNPKPFPEGYFLKVPCVEAQLKTGPLLHRRVVVQSLVFDQPVIDFISDPDGLWNFQTPGESPEKPMHLSIDSVGSLVIKKGILRGSALIDPADTPGPVIFEVQNFSGQINQISFRASRNSSSSLAMTGNLDGDAARFGDVHLKNVHSKIEILPQKLTFKDFRAKTYRGTANGYFTFNFAGKKTVFDTTLYVSGIGVPYLLAEFQNGTPAMTGMMEAKLHLGGEIEHTANPLAGIEGTGLFLIRNGGFPSLAHNKSMTQMKRFRSPDAANRPLSAFSTFGGDLELKNHHIYNKQVTLNFYGIDVKGGGNLNEVNGGLHYSGAAVIEKKQGFFTTTFAKWFKKAEEKNGRLVFPIQLAGTLSNPKFAVVK